MGFLAGSFKSSCVTSATITTHATVVVFVMVYLALVARGLPVTKDDANGDVNEFQILEVEVRSDAAATAALGNTGDVSNAIEGWLNLYTPCGYNGQERCYLSWSYCDTIAGIYGSCQSCVDACDPRRTTGSDYAKANCNAFCKVYLRRQQVLKQQQLKVNATTTDSAMATAMHQILSNSKDSVWDLNPGVLAICGLIIALILALLVIVILLIMNCYLMRGRKQVFIPSMSSCTNLTGSNGDKKDTSGTSMRRYQENFTIKDQDKQTSWENEERVDDGSSPVEIHHENEDENQLNTQNPVRNPVQGSINNGTLAIGNGPSCGVPTYQREDITHLKKRHEKVSLRSNATSGCESQTPLLSNIDTSVTTDSHLNENVISTS